jgi:hypothetical protein
MDPGNKCDICWQQLILSNNDCTKLVCGHWFHTECIHTWINKLGYTKCACCGYIDNYDLSAKDLILEVDKFLLKLLFGDWTHDLTFDGIILIVKNQNFLRVYGWHYSRVIALIISQPSKFEELLEISIVSLLNRGYLFEKDSLFYYNP